MAQVAALRRQIAQGRLTTGAAEAHLTLDDGAAYPLAGELQLTDITVDPATDAVTLRAVFPNPSEVLLPGMFVRATIVEGDAIFTAEADIFSPCALGGILNETTIPKLKVEIVAGGANNQLLLERDLGPFEADARRQHPRRQFLHPVQR